MELISENRAFGGRHLRYEHEASTTQCKMTFAVYLPPFASADKPVPVLYWLSGLTCTDQNFMQKAGAMKLASELGMAIVAPDTSPRGDNIPDDDNGAYDFGLGAGFYVDATQAPWNTHYQMYSYVTEELPQLVEANLPVTKERAISGHSMGGHGALVIGLRNPNRYVSVSAFSPISNPSDCPWGQKALGNYLGSDESEWEKYDTAKLLAGATHSIPLLVEQGSKDEFLAEQLKPQSLVHAAQKTNTQLTLNMHEGYDHSYFFIASFIDEHLAFHAGHLGLI
ncbi:MAG TPA: S-formylglutathione hydrolase [Alteromonas australica]|uniref:S-formylglutathione hydrolase n=1 Tax=Alteromonas australica TaxID=589873 RepID=A0A075P533_9ALTE|nr:MULTISPECIES: S-formylglutathione hydrolase [Alteromonas]MAB93288.1 S-formylglutathione hydrolase [Alteromonas sp.]AIG00071.1 S-formylglutathione hydrolase [Alteromonas australica]AJP45027.1 S-formylglutathione hydrolase [Alteromonas australica]MAF70932.1 S-formylglutathione hydrolase [Alteromonas sp.]MAO29893.1 S-formylglutathione hydrolase [Alteromonas sp.]|tara:strand:- start:2684 stop:3526 length:843 start_codon:yes stop_codon:yes gene_type:complete